MTWEADEVRGGTRKIPGYGGHLPGLRHTLGTTYGNCTAEVLVPGAETDALKAFPSSIIRNRQDGFTEPGHPDYPFKEEMFRTNYAPKSRIIAGHKGHEPGWTHTYGMSQGRYGAQVYQDFTHVTRKLSKSLRVPTTPKDVMSMPDPAFKQKRDDLYPKDRYYIPGTTCYSPAIRERYGHTFSSLTQQAFGQPTPTILDPLSRAEDGPIINRLMMVPGYAGFKPRVLPQLYPAIEKYCPGTINPNNKGAGEGGDEDWVMVQEADAA